MAFDTGRRAVVGGCVLCALFPFGRASVASSQPATDSLSLPVVPACISSPFGPRALPGPHAAAFHTGVDFPAPEGAFVRPAAAGKVLQIRRLSSFGLVVDLLHGEAGAAQFVTRYAHLGAVAPALAEGRRTVAPGEVLGRIGRTGITYGTHLHFEVRVAGQPIDPEPFFAVVRCTQPRAGA
jgi:murein DD-endopeptidase MepM/ murein hydrolase activator NlpD